MPEKQVVFYPAYGYKNGSTWTIPLKLWVKKDANKVRRVAAKGVRKVIKKIVGIDNLTDDQKEIYMSRAGDFFANSKSGVSPEIRFNNDPDNQSYTLVNYAAKDKTDHNGLLEGTLILTDVRVRQLLLAQHSIDGELTFQALTDDYSGSGSLRIIQPVGLSVISDIDDTIKITGIPDGEKTVLNNTFFRPFVAAPCMAAMYQNFDAATAFHYVSGAPWQLYAPIAAFLSDPAVSFPAGSVHMKNVRTNPFESESYRDLWKLVGGSGQATVDQKKAQIETLLADFPQRRFMLIGDSGEYDPEIFKAIQLAHPEQIVEIRIRDVVDAMHNTPDRLRNMRVIDADTQNDACS